MSNKITVTTEEDGRIIVFEGSGTLTLIERAGGWVNTRPLSMTSREVRGLGIEWDGTYMVREADRQNRTLEELRERIARAVVPYMRYEDEWEEADSPDRQRALEIADDVIAELGLAREEERVEPRAGSTTKFAPPTLDALREAWADLADVLAVEMPGIEDEPRIEALAKALHCEHGVRVVGGDEA